MTERQLNGRRHRLIHNGHGSEEWESREYERLKANGTLGRVEMDEFPDVDTGAVYLSGWLSDGRSITEYRSGSLIETKIGGKVVRYQV